MGRSTIRCASVRADLVRLPRQKRLGARRVFTARVAASAVSPCPASCNQADKPSPLNALKVSHIRLRTQVPYAKRPDRLSPGKTQKPKGTFNRTALSCDGQNLFPNRGPSNLFQEKVSSSRHRPFSHSHTNAENWRRRAGIAIFLLARGRMPISLTCTWRADRVGQPGPNFRIEFP